MTWDGDSTMTWDGDSTMTWDGDSTMTWDGDSTTLRPASSHHSTTSELTPLYDQRAHTTL